ncbi:hypothetical protein BD626DRAFT_574149 [Schizophyllum amplum]|uniref:NAD(P)-binding domain-containing protein n=1 Tax=Schizophyllum amplum TaxID=97359 RepID=A0A550BZ45_9AGAR|nr:hypothetical protein BD626DRAFT_574149 [Auriculariopsis ampla]
MHIILSGATGTIGLPVLRLLLSDPTVTRVTALTRRAFEAPTEEGGDLVVEGRAMRGEEEAGAAKELNGAMTKDANGTMTKKANGATNSHHPSKSTYDPSKLDVIVHTDYASYPAELLAQLRGARAAIWAQGISQTEVPKDEYIRITVDYPLAAARAFAGLAGDAEPFTFVYVSGQLAMTSELTPVYFGRIKGRAERLLTELAASSTPPLTSTSPAPSTSIAPLRVLHVRPGIVEVPRRHRPAAPGVRNAERTLSPIFRFFAPGLLSPVGMVAEVLVDLAIRTGAGGAPAGYTEKERRDLAPENGLTVTSPQIKRWAEVREAIGVRT